MVLAGGQAGCLLYTDSINMPPQIEIVDNQGQYFRGMEVTLRAETRDPDEDANFLHVIWRRAESCGKAMISDEAAVGNTFSYRPEKLGSECVVARVIDSKGAFADKTATITVVNQAPKVILEGSTPLPPATSYPLNSRIQISAAKSTDPDPDETNQLSYEWSLFHQPGGETTDLTKSCPGTSCSFLATQSGAYTIKATATDPNGASTSAEKTINIAGDSPPCITRFSPEILHPTLSADSKQPFTVTQVTDDVDAYPGQTSDSSNLGSFQWLFRTSPTGKWLPLSPYTANSVTIASGVLGISAGDTIQVRVMYSDRITRDFSTCWQAQSDRCELSLNCAQGLTWTVTLR